jgi:hypothetical protein
MKKVHKKIEIECEIIRKIDCFVWFIGHVFMYKNS